MREENEQILKTIAAEESPAKLDVDAPLDEQIKYLREDKTNPARVAAALNARRRAIAGNKT